MFCALAVVAVHGDVSHLNAVRDYRSLLKAIDHPALQNLEVLDIEPQRIEYLAPQQELPADYQRILGSLSGHDHQHIAANTGLASNGRWLLNVSFLVIDDWKCKV